VSAYICRRCHEAKLPGDMAKSHGRITNVCRACNAADARARYAANATHTAQLSKVDPCPVCGVRQAHHWRCANCASRGHAMGRGKGIPGLCGWCEAELIARKTQR
jgi:hypothetical protein